MEALDHSSASSITKFTLYAKLFAFNIQIFEGFKSAINF
jgi:hypothetical protein